MADIAEVLLAPTLDDYFVDPANGSDDGSGSANEPLQTLVELSRRITGVLVRQNESLTATLLSDAPADDRLQTTVHLAAGATFTLKGTPTDVAAVTISAAVARPASGATYVWTITTSGIDWTTTTARRILLPTGEVGFVGLVIDANNVACGRFTNETTYNSTTPVAGPATVQTCPKLATPAVLTVPALSGLSGSAFSVSTPSTVIRDLEMSASNLQDLEVSSPTRFYGCIVTPRSIFGGIGLLMQSCLVRLVSGVTILGRISVFGLATTFIGCVFDTDTASPPTFPLATFRAPLTTLRECSFFRTGLAADGITIIVNGGTYYEEGFNQPVIQIANAAVMAMNGAPGTIAEGSVAAGSSAISVTNDARMYYDSGRLPNITGATADCLIGTGTVAYAALPATAVSGSGAAILVSD